MDAITNDFEKRVETAAERGAKKGAETVANIRTLAIAVVLVVGIIIVKRMESGINDKLAELVSFEASASEHELVIEDEGILGYTAADFEEAILRAESSVKKLEVYKYEISDVATITDAGLFKWEIFSKDMLITYTGYANYTVDLEGISDNNITIDNEEKMVILTIPHAETEHINIPAEQIAFGSISKGLLAWGEIKMTPEESTIIQEEAEKRMLNELEEKNCNEIADRFARLSVWELYQPIIKNVSPDYSLEVVFE